MSDPCTGGSGGSSAAAFTSATPTAFASTASNGFALAAA
eukprot:CAMPEP_0171118506 /NCGR_PEP_ID=MMETSP0766_2-20121228/94902_1 /TAXON_ID=439317 /ORGANISM="Gambierdiscus australes, Strain CAWD 149" /LENGTH=38 /DNA_ID= /DNA_START= /DNA_END= /DNA_ORIENTATION=